LGDENTVKRARKIGSIFIVVVSLGAWFAISNHCALGTAIPDLVVKASSGECPFHSKQRTPEKPNPANDSPCCKILRATSAIPAKNPVRQTFDPGAVHSFFPETIVPELRKIVFSLGTLDTGPPAARSFAELILQRSILAHAPPVNG
jgi:hypothetical protein